MSDAHLLITENIDVWTTAIKKRSATGRGSNKKIELTGIKKLRELILELAVRGKLVPQDPNDEPASILLEKIAAEKAQLIKDKKIKKAKVLPEIGESEKPFELPKDWAWAYFPDISYYSPGKTPSTKNATYWEEGKTGIPWVSISDMDHYQAINNTSKKVSKEASTNVFKGNLVKAGTLLMSFKLTVGKISILGIDAYHNEAIIAVTPFDGILQKYLYRFLPSRAQAGNTKKAIMGNTLNSESLALILFPIPPLAEQHRIVSKVDELMALCDQLEQQTEDSITAHKTLVETLLATLSNSENPAAFNQNWIRIAAHFDTLFTTEHSIDQLKQTILQLAVMGKLVPQNPNDEPASVLLEKIAAEKEQLIKDKKIKKQKLLLKIVDEEKLIELPQGWRWAQCADLSNPEAIITYGILKPVWVKNGVLTVRIKDMIKGKVALDNIVQCSLEHANKFSKTTLLENDLLIAKDGGTLGKTAFVPTELVGGNVTQHVLRFSIADKLNRKFIRFIIDSPIGQGWMKRETKGVALPGVNVVDFKRMPMAIPPLNEQYRIVAKVDELMTLCDQLKALLSEAQTTQLHLAGAIVEQAVN